MAKAFPSNPTGARRTAKTSTASNHLMAVGETIAVTAAQAGAVNTLLGSVRIPAGAEITGVKLDSDDLDSNGTPLITLSIGDAGNDSRLLAANTLAQAGGVVNTPAKGALGYLYTTETLVQVKVKAAAATGQAGTIKYLIEYVTN
jgi:hypothetical protein